MPTDVGIRITSSNQTQQAFQQVDRALEGLDQQTRQVQAAAQQTMRAVDGLGREVFETREEAQRFNGVWRDTNGILRNSNGTLAGARRGVDGLSQSFGTATGGTRNFTGALSSIGPILAGLGIVAAGRQLVEYAQGAVNAAVKTEGYMRSLTALYGSAEVATGIFADLNALSELPGITLEGAVQGAIRLKTVNVEGQQANAVIREFGNAAALAGSSSDEMGRALVGLTQTLSRGQIEQDNLNQILENVPLIGNAIRESFGSIDAETIRTELDSAGQSVEDFVNIVVGQLSEGPRAAADSTANAFSNLGNSVFRLQAEIGEQFLPIVRDSTVALSGFLDTIRAGVTDVSLLPEPIQDIVEGAQSLYTGLISVGEAIRSGLGPELDQLLPAIGSLLGHVLDLAGSLINALAPAFEVLAIPTRIAISLIVHLAETVGTVIERITDFVDWIGSLTGAEEQLSEQTQRTTATVEGLVEATKQATAETQRKAEMTRQATAAEKEAATAGQSQAEQLAVTQGALIEVNSQLSEKRARLDRLATTITSTAHPAYVQLERQVKVLEGSSADLTAQVNVLRESVVGVEAPTDTATQAAARLARRSDELQTAIAALPPELTAVRTDIERLTPFTESITSDFNEMMRSLVDLTGEARVYAQVFRELQTPISSVAADQAIANAEFNLVNPAISDAVRSMRDYAGELGTVEGGLIDVETISENVRQSLGTQGSAFDDLRGSVASATSVIDDNIDKLDDVDEALAETAETARQDFTQALDAASASTAGFAENLVGLAFGAERDIDSIIDGLTDLGTSVNEIGLGDVFSSLGTDLGISFATNLLGTIIDELTSGFESSEYKEAISQAFLPGRVLSENLDLSGDIRTLISGFTGSGLDLETLEPLLDDIRGVDPFAVDRSPLGQVETLITSFFGTDVPDLFSTLRDILDEATSNLESEGTDAALQNFITANDNFFDAVIETTRVIGGELGQDVEGLIGELRGQQQSAGNQARSSVSGTVGPAPGYTGSIAEPIGETVAEAVSGVVDEVVDQAVTSIEDTPELADFFSFSRGERGILKPLEQNVRTAQDFINDFITEDSSPEDIQAAYTALADAEQALYDQQVSFIENATGITEGTRERALEVAEQVFDREIREANDDLVEALGDIGYQLVETLTFTSGILQDTALAVQQIPQEVEQVLPETPTVDEASAEVPDPVELQDFFSFGRGERGILQPLEQNVRTAQDFINDFITEDSSPEDIQQAYTDLANAENALYDQQVSFIQNAVGITDKARENALDVAEQVFDREIREANDDLVEALGDIGYQLVEVLTFTSGILTETALAVQQIPEIIEEQIQDIQDISTTRRDPLTPAERQRGGAEPPPTTIGPAEPAPIQDISTTRRDPLTPAERQRGGAEPPPTTIGPEVLDPEPELELQDFFSFSRGERGILAPLEQNVRTAQDFINDFITEDSSPEDIQAAYTALADAEQSLYDQQVSFIENATGITEDTRGRALEVAESVFNREIREANDDLVDALADIGSELVTVITFTSGILRDTALAVQEIPQEVEQAMPEVDAPVAARPTAAPTTEALPEAVEPEPPSTALLRNQVERASFDVGGATGETDFEARRQTLINSINAFYDAELARIAEVAENETELQDLREDNALARDRSLQRALGLTNTFREDRLDLERETAETLLEIDSDLAEALAGIESELAEERQGIRESLSENLAGIEENLTETISDINTDLAGTLAGIDEGLADDRERITERLADTLLDIDEGLVDDREQIAERLSDTLLDIDEGLVDDREQIAERLSDTLVGIDEGLADDREQIAERLSDTLLDIDEGLADDRERINERLASAIASADERLADTRERITEGLSDTLLGIDEGLADDSEQINERLASAIASADERLADTRVRIHRGLSDTLLGIDEGLADDREQIAERLSDTLLGIDEGLADDRERITERLNDRLSDLADDAVNTEQDRLSRIEDLNRDHQESLEDIRLRGVRRQEDIELGLNRRISDIQRDAARDISELEDDPRLGPRTQAARRQEAVAEIQREVAQRIEDARLRATRARADLETDAERRRADLETDRALSIAEIEQRSAEAQAEILGARAEARQMAETVHQAAIGEAEDARLEARQASEIAHEAAIADAQEAQGRALQESAVAHQEAAAAAATARIRARQAAEAAHAAALAEAEEARVAAQQASEIAHQEAIADAEEARVEARQAAATAHQEALAEAEEARVEARQAAATAHQEALAEAEEARTRANQQAEEAHQEALGEAEEARVRARQAAATAHQEALAEAEEARTRANQQAEEAHQEALADAADARVEARRDAEEAHQAALADAEGSRARARQIAEAGHQKALADAEDARGEARQIAETAHAAALAEAEAARVEANRAAETAHQEANRAAETAHQEAIAEAEVSRVAAQHASETRHREVLANIEMQRQTERLGIYEMSLLRVEDLIDDRYSERASMLTASVERAFASVPDRINIDLPDVQPLLSAQMLAPQVQANSVPNGGSPARQPQANRPIQIHITNDNSRRVGSTEIKDIHRETVIIEDDGRVVV